MTQHYFERGHVTSKGTTLGKALSINWDGPGWYVSEDTGGDTISVFAINGDDYDEAGYPLAEGREPIWDEIDKSLGFCGWIASLEELV